MQGKHVNALASTLLQSRHYLTVDANRLPYPRERTPSHTCDEHGPIFRHNSRHDRHSITRHVRAGLGSYIQLKPVRIYVL